MPITCLFAMACGGQTTTLSAKSVPARPTSAITLSEPIFKTAESEHVSPTYAGLHAPKIGVVAQPTLDGVLGDWPELIETSVHSGTSTPKSRVGLVYDDERLFVAAEVADPMLQRTERFLSNEDVGELHLGVPRDGGALDTIILKFFVGKIGESEGAVTDARGKKLVGAHIVESATSGGYSLEASVPWRSFLRSDHARVGLRGAWVSRDGGTGSTSATAKFDGAPASWPWIPTEPELAVMASGVPEQGLRVAHVTNLIGSPEFEAMLTTSNTAYIVGPAFAGGTAFASRKVTGKITKSAVATAGAPRRILVEVQTPEKTDTPAHLEVWHVTGQGIEVDFSHGLRHVEGTATCENRWALRGATLELRGQGHACALDLLKGASAAGMAMLRQPSDRLDVALSRGDVREAYVAAISEALSKGRNETLSVANSAPVPPSDVPPPQLAKRDTHIEAYLRARQLPLQTKPTQVLNADLDGDGKDETTALFGGELVVFGATFLSGERYITLRPGGVGEVSTITKIQPARTESGAQLCIRSMHRLASESSAPVLLETLACYRIVADKSEQTLWVEVGRKEGANQIVTSVVTGNGSIAVTTTRIVGWSQAEPPPSPPKEVHSAPFPWISDTMRYEWRAGAWNLSK